jgi:hypothetical protein
MTRLTLDAVAAFAAPVFAAGSAESKDDSVADRDRCFGTWTESFNDADSFVAKRPVTSGEFPITTSEMKIGVANPA